MLEPKISSQDAAFALAATGAIKDEILPLEDLAFRLFKQLHQEYSVELSQRYDLDLDLEADTFDVEYFYDKYIEAARHKGCVLSGGRIDTERFARMLLSDFRSGKIGRISLERPE